MAVVPNSPLALYLRNHEAAARAGVDLARRAASGQRGRPWADVLQWLAQQVAEDLDSLQAVLASLGIRPDLLLGLALRSGERVGRLKPNGSLVRRAPLSDLIEVEALLDALRAKGAGWQALRSAVVAVPESVADLAELTRRVERQLAELDQVHEQVAGQVLTTADS